MQPSDLHKYAWDYFALHSGQRLTLFNFFVSVSALLTTGMVATFQKEFRAPGLGCALGLMLVAGSFLFWKLDERTRYLIKLAERALATLEQDFPLPDSAVRPHATQLVLSERNITQDIRSLTDRTWNEQMSYAKTFRLVFVCVALIGVFGAGASFL